MTSKEAFLQLRDSVNRLIIGQAALVDRLMVALLCDGHLLVEGAPGLAKTRAIKVLSEGIEGNFQRVQFTPDLLPADLTGTEIFRPQDASFKFQAGPLFHNMILADEINRAPAKVQAALLEAMAERQITVGAHTYRLPDLFLVMATQNPIEQEGTYPLPEAQLDRFLLYVKIDFPSAKAEQQILHLARQEAIQENQYALEGGGERVKHESGDLRLSQKQLFEARQEVLNVHMSEGLEKYLLEIVLTTRNPKLYGEDIAYWVQYGASPRASIALDRCARAHAWIMGRDYVDPEDVQAMAYDVLRHRVLLSYEAEAEGVDADRFIDELIARIPLP